VKGILKVTLTSGLTFMGICCRLTNQARAAAAAAAAINFTSPEQLNPQQQQQRSYSKPSSLDVLSESAASQVGHLPPSLLREMRIVSILMYTPFLRHGIIYRTCVHAGKISKAVILAG
jgi:hypothetical protein